jgi:AcrR family transcriptional regulator
VNGVGSDAHVAASSSAPVIPVRRRRASRGSGDLLRGQVLVAARELLARTRSVDAVSVRAIAERVGVTPPSIYRHFSDKQALIDAVVADVFAELDKHLHEATRDATRPIDRLLACGRAYVAFALQRPEHYRLGLMGHANAASERANPALVRSVLGCLEPFVAACVREGSLPRRDLRSLTLELWATAHGVASLLITIPDSTWGDRTAFVDRTLCAAAKGLDALGCAPPMTPQLAPAARPAEPVELLPTQ